MKNSGRLFFIAALLILLAVGCKILFGSNLSWSGFSPIMAIALFSGMIIHKKDQSFALPLAALLISDLIIHALYLGGLFDYAGFYPGQWMNYVLLLGCTAIGWWLKGRSVAMMILAAIVGPTVYFLISNFFAWLGIPYEMPYAKTFEGLIACYTSALPFYRNSVAATVVFLPAIAFAYNYLMAKKATLRLA